jgi:pilus assembly protein Flp/PilA
MFWRRSWGIIGPGLACISLEGGVSVLFLPNQTGQGLVEYALLLVMVAVVIITVLLLLGPVVGNVFSNIVAAI